MARDGVFFERFGAHPPALSHAARVDPRHRRSGPWSSASSGTFEQLADYVDLRPVDLLRPDGGCRHGPAPDTARSAAALPDLGLPGHADPVRAVRRCSSRPTPWSTSSGTRWPASGIIAARHPGLPVLDPRSTLNLEGEPLQGLCTAPTPPAGGLVSLDYARIPSRFRTLASLDAPGPVGKTRTRDSGVRLAAFHLIPGRAAEFRHHRRLGCLPSFPVDRGSHEATIRGLRPPGANGRPVRRRHHGLPGACAG